jgi:hypothetical protein
MEGTHSAQLVIDRTEMFELVRAKGISKERGNSGLNQPAGAPGFEDCRRRCNSGPRIRACYFASIHNSRGCIGGDDR